jgi:hypothetical protein
VDRETEDTYSETSDVKDGASETPEDDQSVTSPKLAGKEAIDDTSSDESEYFDAPSSPAIFPAPTTSAEGQHSEMGASPFNLGGKQYSSPVAFLLSPTPSLKADGLSVIDLQTTQIAKVKLSGPKASPLREQNGIKPGQSTLPCGQHPPLSEVCS